MAAEIPPVLTILGPTASGKSAAAMALARVRPIEIISVDSAQVYQDLDLGTAKPSAAELAEVPHHLIDIVSPADRYSAARFAHDAAELIPQIRARNREPVIVGGTMLYIKALIEGLHNLPIADPGLREQLEDDARTSGWPAMHARLADLDPPTAARLKPTDSQRIQRALEICLLSGQAMSTLLSKARNVPGSGGLRFTRVALEPSDRLVLHQRIETRFRQMISNGLIDEVRQLRDRDDLHADLPSMRCVGYRQVWRWFDEGARPGQLEAMIQSGIAATRQLAKRQLTWLRASPDRISIDCLAQDCAEQVIRLSTHT